MQIYLDTSPSVDSVEAAGFDHDADVFRIFDVWETREQGERFISEQLQPILDEIRLEQSDP